MNTGDKAPLWRLDNQNEESLFLGDFIGNKNIILSFHPLAWTPVCSQQMKDLDSKFNEFSENDTVAFGLSVDSSPCKKAWAESLRIKHTNLPSDFWPHGAVAQEYGVFNEQFGFSNRAVFVIAKNGTIAFKRVYPAAQLPDIDEIAAVVQRIAHEEIAEGVARK